MPINEGIEQEGFYSKKHVTSIVCSHECFSATQGHPAHQVSRGPKANQANQGKLEILHK